MSDFYIKPFIQEFGKRIRVYVPSDGEDGDTFVSIDLIEAINPDLILEDEYGFYANLTLCFGQEEINICFSIIDTGGNDIQMSGRDLDNLLQDNELGARVRIYEA